MITNAFFVNAPKSPIRQNSLAAIVEEICKNDPKPLFCELPDDLKLKSISYSGTLTYSYNSLATTTTISGTATGGSNTTTS